MAFMGLEVMQGTKFYVTDHSGDLSLYDEMLDVQAHITEADTGEEVCVEKASGFWARLSAPGYLDCTEWCGPFTSYAEAEQFMRDNYPDECAPEIREEAA